MHTTTPGTHKPVAPNLDSESARTLFHHAGKVIIRNLPVETNFGIDFAEWTIGPIFSGIKFIPPGLHFIHYRITSNSSLSSSSQHETDFRCGFFFWIKQGETLVFEWDKNIEDLLPEPKLDQDHVNRLKFNILELDRYLGTYPLDSHANPLANLQAWPRLTKYITPHALNSIIPTSYPGFHSISAMMESNLSNNKSISKQHTIPSSSSELIKSGGNLHFNTFDLRRSWDPIDNNNPSAITKYSLDKSWLLLHTYGNNIDYFLGELQISFIILLIGHNYEGFEQWKRLLHLVCQSRDALISHPQLFISFLDVLHDQLAECPRDFFVDILSSGNFIFSLLSKLIQAVLSPDSDEPPRILALADATKRIKQFCLDRFGLELNANEPREYINTIDDIDDGEDGPVVVDLQDQEL